jgi:hypothetical protein
MVGRRDGFTFSPFGKSAVIPSGGFLFGYFSVTHCSSRMPERFVIGRCHAPDGPAGLIALSRTLMMTNHPAVIGWFHGYFRPAVWRVHHARLPAFLARRDDETRWGVFTATPPDLPEGLAVGSRNSLRGFSGISE